MRRDRRPPLGRLRASPSPCRARGRASLPLDESNLAFRAALLLAERSGLEPSVDLHIHKAIPIAGGMAGGSADAAGALLACDALWRLAHPA